MVYEGHVAENSLATSFSETFVGSIFSVTDSQEATATTYGDPAATRTVTLIQSVLRALA